MHVKLFGRCPNIPFFIPIRLNLPPKRSDEHIAAYIKLPPTIQPRHDILLHNNSRIVNASRTNEIFYFSPLLRYTNTCSSVGVFSWFDDPS